MSFGVIVLLQKTILGTVYSLYFRFYKKDECNMFPFLDKKHRKTITQSIRNVNA